MRLQLRNFAYILIIFALLAGTTAPGMSLTTSQSTDKSFILNEWQTKPSEPQYVEHGWKTEYYLRTAARVYIVIIGTTKENVRKVAVNGTDRENRIGFHVYWAQNTKPMGDQESRYLLRELVSAHANMHGSLPPEVIADLQKIQGMAWNE